MAILWRSLWMDLLGILVAIVAIGVAYIKWRFTYWDKRGIPCLKPSFPFGNATDLILQRKSFGECFAAIYNAFKETNRKFVGAFFFTRPILIVMDPELIKNVMTKDFDHFVDRGMYVNEKEDPVAAHLFTLPGKKWRDLRVKFTPTFTSGKMKMMFQTLVDCSDGLTKVFEDYGKGCVDIKDVVGRYTTDVIGSCAFGLECNSLKHPETDFRVFGKKIFNPTYVTSSIKMFFSFCAPRILEVLNVRVVEKDTSDFFMNLVKDTIEYREKNNVQRKDFMNLLIQLKNTGKLEEEVYKNGNHQNGNHQNGNFQNGKSSESATPVLTFEQIAAQSFLFFAAGFETSATTLTFCLYELVKNIHIQEKLRQEINEVLAKHDGKITYEGIVMDMKYMENVINETLRKYPPVPVLNRVCTKEYHLPEMDLHVPKGGGIFIPVQALQNDPKHYPNPEKFDPDRFTDEVKQTRHPYTFLPFGEGPRVCIGLRFGMMQTKVALTVLLKNFNFTLSKKTEEPFVMDTMSFIWAVKNGIWLKAAKIEA